MQQTVQDYTSNPSKVSDLVNYLYDRIGGVKNINPYLLGAGSFGAVFALPGNPCIVLKVVQFKGNGGLADKRSFENEVKKASIGSVYYDNFIKNYSVPILGSVTMPDSGVYFMPNLSWYGDNVVPLQEWIKKHPNMSDPMYDTIFRKLRTALMAMYNSGLVHGDLHTGNIHVIFSNSGEITKVLVADLGTAIGIEDAKTNSRRSAVTKLKQSTTIKSALNAAHEVWQSENVKKGNFPEGTGIYMKGDQTQQPYRSNKNILQKVNPAFPGLGIGRYEIMNKNGKKILKVIGPVPPGETTYGKLVTLSNNTGMNTNISGIQKKVIERARHLFLEKAYDTGNVGVVDIESLLRYIKQLLESNATVPNKSIIPQILKITEDDLKELKRYMKYKQNKVAAEFKNRGHVRENIPDPNKNMFNRLVQDTGALDNKSVELMKKFLFGLAEKKYTEGNLNTRKILTTFIRTYLQGGIQNGRLPNVNTVISQINPNMSQNVRQSLIDFLNKDFIQKVRGLQNKTKNLVNRTYNNNKRGAKKRVMNLIKQNIDTMTTNNALPGPLNNTNQMASLLKQYLLAKATVYYDSFNTNV